MAQIVPEAKELRMKSDLPDPFSSPAPIQGFNGRLLCPPVGVYVSLYFISVPFAAREQLQEV